MNPNDMIAIWRPNEREVKVTPIQYDKSMMSEIASPGITEDKICVEDYQPLETEHPVIMDYEDILRRGREFDEFQHKINEMFVKYRQEQKEKVKKMNEQKERVDNIMSKYGLI